MNTRDYFIKIGAHLQDHNTYKRLTQNPISAIANDACTLIEYMYFKHIIDKANIEVLLPPNSIRTPLFYGLHKIYEPDCPLSACITHFIKPLASNLPSNIKDTKYFVNLNYKLPSLPSDSFSVAADVTSLCIHKTHARRRNSSRDSIHGKMQTPATYKLSTSLYSVCHNRFHPQTLHLEIHGHAYTRNPWDLHWHLDGSPLCQPIHGQGATHDNPKFPQPNYLLEMFH